MATKYGGNIAIHLHESLSSDPYFFNCSYVYVKCDSTFSDHWQQRFFRCIGGKIMSYVNAIKCHSSLPILGVR
jgi:hypothetical protein